MRAGWNKTRGCPKCGSRSIYLDCDENDWYTHCLLCGHMVPVKLKEITKTGDTSFSFRCLTVLKAME